MQSSNSPASTRRSSRVPVNVPILVTSLQPGARFSEVCETMVVNAHGCALKSPTRLSTGVLLHFHAKDGRETTAKVVDCQPLDSEQRSWQLSAQLSRPENFWGLKTFPQDWAALSAASLISASSAPTAKTYRQIQPLPEKVPASLKAMLDNLQKQVADERLQAMVASAVQPLRSEIAELREKLARSTSKERSKFEVSLSHIPPELQVQIEGRLRSELGPRVLDEARVQSAQVLESAKKAIETRTADSHTEFRQRVSEDLQAAEKRVQTISEQGVESLRDYSRREMGEFHQHVVEAKDRLKDLSEELLQMQRRALTEVHDTHLREQEHVQAKATSEWSSLREKVADLDGRIGKLVESVAGLESGLDVRLSKLASNTVSGTRAQLESAADAILEDMGTRSTRQLSEQVDKASASLETIQKEIEHAASDSMDAQAARSLETFAQHLDNLAHQAVEQCRGVLARGLNSVLRNLGEQFQSEQALSERAERARSSGA